MTEHKCKDGKWKPDKTRFCGVCNPPKKVTLTIMGDLPGSHTGAKLLDKYGKL